MQQRAGVSVWGWDAHLTAAFLLVAAAKVSPVGHDNRVLVTSSLIWRKLVALRGPQCCCWLTNFSVHLNKEGRGLL